MKDSIHADVSTLVSFIEKIDANQFKQMILSSLKENKVTKNQYDFLLDSAIEVLRENDIDPHDL